MPTKYKIEYLPIAQSDLNEIFDYIQIDAPESAMDVLNEFDSKITLLSSFPQMGTIPKDERLMRLGYRMLVIRNYVVFYVITEDVIEIRRVIHGNRNYSFLL